MDLKSDAQFKLFCNMQKSDAYFFYHVKANRYLIITHDKIKRLDNQFLALIRLTAGLSLILI